MSKHFYSMPTTEKQLIQSGPCLIAALWIAIMISACSGSKVTLQTQIDAVNSIEHEKVYANQLAAPWAVGQWALYKTRSTAREEIFRLFNKDPQQGLRKISISGKSNGSFWLEQHIVLPDHEQSIAALVTVGNQSQVKDFKIIKLKFTQANGKTVVLEEQNFTDGSVTNVLEEMQFLINLLAHSARSGRSRTITIPAGTFENTNEVPMSMSLLLGQVKGNVLYSDAVPILTVAKMHITQDTSGWFKNTMTWELVDFGLAESSSLAFEKDESL